MAYEMECKTDVDSNYYMLGQSDVRYQATSGRVITLVLQVNEQPSKNNVIA